MRIVIRIERKKQATPAEQVQEMVHIAEQMHRLEVATAALDCANLARKAADLPLTPVYAQLQGQIVALKIRQAALLAGFRERRAAGLV